MGNASGSDRALLAKLSRAAKGGLLSVVDAAAAIGISRTAAAMKLASLTRRGWLVRARRGLYLIPPLEAEPGKPSVAEDPWIVAREAFSPCYIGGWSAAEHWGLTEQLFRGTLVVTAAHVRSRSRKLLEHEFRLFRVAADRIAGGVTPVWRGAERVLVSSRERTIVDCLRNPELCGGIRHLADMLEEYGRAPERDFKKLLAEAEGFASGAAWKRLGHLAELLWPGERAITEEATRRLTAGYSRLDPAVRRRGRLVRRWRLWVNVSVGTGGAS
ncbi:MAG: type IV toxin-antitoxin system AbiEi family antitoxin domain-containing protein [Gemmatimonadetes bacterium]|nr:type IV toxin-antitoxin system AbiEi family antitoxin domain-containing protein [Gemmatimonadota bacterium]